MKDDLGLEKVIHGPRWDAVHSGYFSDPRNAEPLLATVRKILAAAPAEAVVDLGGGTGFILSRLEARGMSGPALVNRERRKELPVIRDERSWIQDTGCGRSGNP